MHRAAVFGGRSALPDIHGRSGHGASGARRLHDPWHPNTLRGVLEEKHQFPVGNYYDADSLRAAHEALAGRRSLPADVMYFQSTGAQNRWEDTWLYKTVGGLSFYTRDGNR